MKTAASLLTVFAFAAFCASSALAADTTPTPQQQKFGACAKDAHAKGLKGDDYKSYMSTCAKADSATPAAATDAAPVKMTQQEKMKSCNADATAKSLKGDDRKQFMSTCLSDQPAAAH